MAHRVFASNADHLSFGGRVSRVTVAQAHGDCAGQVAGQAANMFCGGGGLINIHAPIAFTKPSRCLNASERSPFA